MGRYGCRACSIDALLAATDFNATRAVTINATPEEIWPWIVQIGDQRAGFYGYDWFDNRFTRSAEEIIPEFQDLKIGDEVPISSLVSQTVWLLEPYEAMVWVGGGDEIDGTWSWGLYPLDDERTRLVTRLRGKYHWSKPTIMFNLLIEGGDLPFMRKCLLGIKQRAEGNITDTFLREKSWSPSKPTFPGQSSFPGRARSSLTLARHSPTRPS